MALTPQQEVAEILRDEMDARGWHDNDWRAGLAAIVGGESHFTPKFETGYSHTDNTRIRKIFRNRTANLSDAQLDEIKRTDRGWFNFVYGGRYGNKPGTDDGFTYRGGGLNQLTFHDNYALYGSKVGVDLVNHPELVNTPRVAAAVAVEYMKDRFHGGDFDAMKAAVGVSIGEPDEEKNRLYARYTATGEWDYQPTRDGTVKTVGTTAVHTDLAGPVVGTTAVRPAVDRLKAIQTVLQEGGQYRGQIDGKFGAGSRMALDALIDRARVEGG